MKKFLIAIALLVSFNAFAELNSESVRSAGFNKLTPAQQADIISQVAKQKEANDATKPVAGGIVSSVAAEASSATPEKVASWVDVGTKVGKALGGAAREVGVAVNEFAGTPVGILTMSIIVWQYMGSVLVHIIGGVLVLLSGLGFLRYMTNRQYPDVITYNYEKLNWRGKPTIASMKKTPIPGDEAAGYIFCAAVVIIASLITVFTF